MRGRPTIEYIHKIHQNCVVALRLVSGLHFLWCEQLCFVLFRFVRNVHEWCAPTLNCARAHALASDNHFVNACLGILFKLFNSKRSVSLCAGLSFSIHPSIHCCRRRHCFHCCLARRFACVCTFQFPFQFKPTIGLQFFLQSSVFYMHIWYVECDNSLLLSLNKPHIFLLRIVFSPLRPIERINIIETHSLNWFAAIAILFMWIEQQREKKWLWLIHKMKWIASRAVDGNRMAIRRKNTDKHWSTGGEEKAKRTKRKRRVK